MRIQAHIASFGLALLCLLSVPALGQTMSHSAVSSAGDHYTAGGIQVSFTIGEALTEQDVFAGGQVNRGFHQHYFIRSAVFDTICEGGSVMGYTETGVYEDLYTLPGGIDSLRILYLTVLPPLSITADVNNVLCNGDGDGSITLSVIGGSEPYTYQWSTGDDTESVIGLGPGNYSVIVSDLSGCQAAMNFPITEPDAIFLSAMVTDASCLGATDGAIGLTIGGGVGPYDFAWSSGDVSQDLSGIGMGEYSVSVTDANGCQENLVSLQVIETLSPPALPGTISGNISFCAGEEALFSVAPVPTADSYTWTLPNGWGGNSTNATIIATAGSAGGTVSVTAVNACGTSAVQTLQVASVPASSTLMGTVSFNGNAVTSGWVYTYTEIAQATGYEKADSVPIVNGLYSFASLPLYPASFILQAVAGPGHGGAVPTFFAQQGMSHQWDNPALDYSLFSVCGETQVRNINIIVQEILQDDPGFCTLKGQVRWIGEDKMAEDPIPQIDVVVERVPPGGSAYAIDQTDNDGRYEFTGVPAVPAIGFFYRIYVSIPGIPMSDTYSIIITSTDTLIENLDFIVDTINNVIYPVGDSTYIGINGLMPAPFHLTLMPNPMSDRMTVLLPKGPLCERYRITHMSGIVAEEDSVTGIRRSFTIERGQLPAGLYLLEVFFKDGRRLTERFLAR